MPKRFGALVNRFYPINIEEQKRGRIEERASRPGIEVWVLEGNFPPHPVARAEEARSSWKIIFIPGIGFDERCVTPKAVQSLKKMGQWNSLHPFPAVQRSNKCRGCCDWSWWDSCCWPAPRYSRSIAIFTKPDRCTVIGPSFSIPPNGLPERCGWSRVVYEESSCSRGPITIYSPSMFFWVRFAVENNNFPALVRWNDTT